MANYATAVLAKGQAIVTDKNQQPEQRRKLPTVFELSLRNQEYSIPDANELRKSPLRPVEINFFTDVAPGAGVAKAYNHTGSYGDSGKVQLVYVQLVETFGIPRKIADNNIMTYQNIFNNLYEMKWKNLRTRHDTAALAFIYANRAQLTNAVMDPQIQPSGFGPGAGGNFGSWNQNNFAIEVNANTQARFIQLLKAVMKSRHYGGELDIVADLQLAAQFDYAAQQGQGNMANTSFQFAGTNIAETQDLIDGTYPNGAVLAFPKGLFAGMCWNEALNKRGVDEDPGGAIGILGTIQDPFGSGAIADLSMYTQRADTSANASGGSTQDIVDQWEITVTMAYAAPPLSAAGDSVIHEFAAVA
jgi:hypothetical protein